MVFFFKQKTAYEMRISDWSSDVCSSDLVADDALQLPAGDVQDWLELAPTERAPWLERGDLRASAALLLLEEAALRREELLARDELKRLLLGRQAKDNA